MSAPGISFESSLRARAARCLVVVLAAILGGCAGHKEATYDTPDAAVQALVSALRSADDARLLEVLGPEGDDVINSGDPVADRSAAERFLAGYDEKHELVDDPNGDMTLNVGPQDWPFPIPLVKGSKGWSWDTAAGKDEILSRRIGANELSTIQVCLAIGDAQQDYVALDPSGDGVPQYARKIMSDPGKRDGLFWPVAEGEAPSPLGPLAADAAGEGYTARQPGDAPRPYHGYFYHLLTSQGPTAIGGAMDYVQNGMMIGGFGVVAWPASYGNSGIMSFIMNQDGVVYQKDLGPGTNEIAGAMTSFDPGDGWTEVAVQE